ncbi:hypothetical protein TNCT_727281 [Trichonephila clavata]|uniref:Uncharacterized protein n=1 Tax=Trichonephila clavata TaxID=2740835 RepID=A0A8X6I211_TRICU|nr:hypothetical protein TNCT_727281 [Trichonephila clavata]
MLITMPKERIFLQSQEKKSSSDAKEDKMKHSGNPEVITQSEIVLSKGLASILTNLRETRIDTAKKENQHIILENVSEERNILNSQAEKSENVSEERNFEFSSRKPGKNKSFNSDVDNHARREKIFLQSQDRKNSSSDAKEDKMKHSSNPEVMNTELNSPQQGSSKYFDKLEIETSIDTAKKEYQHIILENVSEERNISNSHAEKSGKNKSFNSDIDNHARKEKIFLHLKKEKIPHLMRSRIR